MDFFGWYTCGDVPDDGDILIHKQICDINECPVLMKLNPLSRNEGVSLASLNILMEAVDTNFKCFTCFSNYQYVFMNLLSI